MMLDAGREVLLTIEPTLGFEQLTYSTVFDYLQKHHGQRVTIGSVHERIWKSQRDFQLEVVRLILQQPVTPATDLAMVRAAEAIGKINLDSPEGRKYALRTAVRLNSPHFFDLPMAEEIKIAHMVRFQLWAAGADHPEAADFLEAITKIREDATAAYSAIARTIVDIIGLRLRPGVGEFDEVIETIAILGNAVAIGLQTDVLPQSQQPRRLPTGPNGELEDWYHDSIALWSTVSAMFELDGDDLTLEQRRL